MKNQKKQPKQTPFNQYWIFGSIVFVFLLLNIFSGTGSQSSESTTPYKFFEYAANGDVEKRPYIKTDILMDGITKNIELTLTDRGPMDYTMLIGRKALGRRWVVNPSIGFLTKPSGE